MHCNATIINCLLVLCACPIWYGEYGLLKKHTRSINYLTSRTCLAGPTQVPHYLTCHEDLPVRSSCLMDLVGKIGPGMDLVWTW